MLDFTTILSGIPITSNRGALGWCTVVYLFLNGKHILFDTGSYGDRGFLLQRFQDIGISPDQIDIVVVSHLHYDHFLNVELFSKAKILVSRRELEYSLSGEYLKAKDPYVPISFIRYFADRLVLLESGYKIVPELEVIALPGHTPGLIGMYYEKDKILFASDAVKNAWDFKRNEPPPIFFSRSAALKTYSLIKDKAQVIVPGHDKHFTLGMNKSIQYYEKYSYEIRTYIDPNKEETVYSIG
jgi:glyoxylase-like metal-dependent hydrolase (beta-lactamase superfamily II)